MQNFSKKEQMISQQIKDYCGRRIKESGVVNGYYQKISEQMANYMLKGL